MAINTWWGDAPAERYWMEVTDRADLGSDLIAPQTDDAGRANWTYNLVSHVQDGDIVLHWHKTLVGEPAIVGFSIVDGAPYASTIRWESRGTSGRARRGHVADEPGWKCDLGEYRPLDAPVTLAEVRSVEPALRAVHDHLARQHAGALYFPFAFSPRRPLRAQQGYLVKVPAAVLDVIATLKTVPRGQRPAFRAPAIRRRTRSRAGRVSDPVLRKALERHAVARATEYYESLGYADIEDVGAYEPFDLVVADGYHRRHVEVKGSSGDDIAEVELTDGEVRQCTTAPTDLFVVDSIRWYREADGTITTVGGRARVWRGWTAPNSTLRATRYRHTLSTRGTEL